MNKLTCSQRLEAPTGVALGPLMPYSRSQEARFIASAERSNGRQFDGSGQIALKAATLMETQLLHAFYPRAPIPGSHIPMDQPFISDVGGLRRLHFDWSSLQSEMDIGDPVRLTVDYTRVMMGFLFFDRYPRRIEMIGLGGGSLAKFCFRFLPQADITVVEIDPHVIALRDRFMVPPDNDRFRVICADGADYVRNAPPRPDVLLVDGFDPFGQPPQLCSSDFYSECHRRLTHSGILAVNLWGGDQHNGHYQKRIHQAFHGEAIILPTEGGSNRAVLARKATPLSLSKVDVMTVNASLDIPEAAFLAAIGQRIRRELHKISHSPKGRQCGRC